MYPGKGLVEVSGREWISILSEKQLMCGFAVAVGNVATQGGTVPTSGINAIMAEV